MLDLTEIIKKAEEAPRQTTDVEVIFNAGIAYELEELRGEQKVLAAELDDIELDLQAELEQLQHDRRASDSRPAAAKKATEARKAAVHAQIGQVEEKIQEAEARAADYLVTFRFTAMHGFEWDALTATSMRRDGNAEDQVRGYNSDEVTLTAAKRTAVRVTPDGDLLDVTSEQWDGIWKTLPAEGRRQIKHSLWVLHEYAPRASQNEAVVAARKVSAAQQAPTSPATPASPSDSGSTPADSAAGNQPASPTTSTTSKAA